ncbi:iron ABC transporter permease [Brevibacillus formosus]|uniref:ABC transporter permease n=2 Tax=Brevibacillus formosus TaxID=54913 RepID=A0ABQ0TBY5_9BACL|nr:iron ABC transporter permease [Brevibacillus formosus]MED1958476.1 iron ABC transporter permease [Brevibacillus formosus]GED60154.1 ABC transporter permease [Brevibacillus formosus]
MQSNWQAAVSERKMGERRKMAVPLSLEKAATWIVLVPVAFFFIYPLWKLIALSVQTEAGIGLRYFADVITHERTWNAIGHSVMAAGASTLIALVIGVSLAWLCAYTDIRWKSAIHVLALLPLLIPSYVMTLAWTQLAGPQGVLNRVASWLYGGPLELWNVYGLDGIIVVMGLTHYPLVYMLTLSVLYRIPKELEWAAHSSGATATTVFRKVTLPLALPGIAGGGLLAFISGLDNFGVPAFLGIPENIPLLSTLIYEEVIGFGPSAFARASVLSILLGVIALAGTGVQWLFLRKSRVDQTSAEDKSIRRHLEGYRRGVEVLVGLFLLVTSVLPLLSMAANAFIKAYGLPFVPQNLTWKHFAFVLFDHVGTRAAIGNSLMLACLTGVLCVVAGTWFAYWRIHRPSFMGKVMEGAVALPYALPGMVLGLAMILTWIEPIPGWQPGIYGTVWLILIAYVTRFLILQVKSSTVSIMQVGKEVEEAARINGGRFWTRWSRILLPLYAPGMATGLFLVFLTAFTELTISSLLWSSGSETIGVVIFSFEQAGSTTHSTALSSLIVAAILLVLAMGGLWKRYWQRRIQG